MTAAFVQTEILGLRDLRGRFAAMANAELQELQMQAAEALAESVKHIYQAYAPRGRSDKFMEGIEGAAQWTGHGFLVEIVTADPRLREWLREGTGIFGPQGMRIYPTNSPVMVWEGDDGELVFAASTSGMEPNDWEVYASLESAPMVLLQGNRIGRQAVDRLGGKP